MKISQEQMNELEKITQSLVEWLRNNSHPHTSIIVTDTSIRLVEDIASIPYTTVD